MTERFGMESGLAGKEDEKNPTGKINFKYPIRSRWF